MAILGGWWGRVAAAGLWGGLLGGGIFAGGAAAQAPAEPFTRESGEFKFARPLTFKTGSGEIQPEHGDDLKALAAHLKDRSDYSTVRVEGHVGSLTGAQADELSAARAKSVVKALIAAGVDCKRLLPVSFGDTKPVAAAKAAENTRITIQIAGLRGRAIGGMPLDGGGRVVGDACAL